MPEDEIDGSSIQPLEPAPESTPDLLQEEEPTPITAGTAALRWLVSVETDVGCVRTNNEDCFGYDQDLGIFVVCDGMGGMASGEVASARAVAALITDYAASRSTAASISARLLQAVQAANHDVWEGAQTPEHKGMGTTMVAVALDGNRAIVGNVGDSRAYVLRHGGCAQLTVDHSYLNELIRNGTLTMENASRADLQGMESVICRAIGAGPVVDADFFSVDMESGTALLLASDGLTRYLLQDEIAAVLGASPLNLACRNLIELAKQRGGVDNITCLVLMAVQDEE